MELCIGRMQLTNFIVLVSQAVKIYASVAKNFCSEKDKLLILKRESTHKKILFSFFIGINKATFYFNPLVWNTH